MYSPKLDGVFCLPCALFVTDREGKGSLVNGAFNKWTKISDTLVVKKGHATKTYHSNAVAAMDSWLFSMNHPDQTIPAHMDKELLRRIAANRHIVGRIAQAVLFCGRQCIALREDSEDVASKGNPGNFLAYLKDVATSDDVLKHHIYAPLKKNATYLSPRCQNEIIDIIGQQQILASILEEVRKARYFSVLADEVTSHNQEQMALCVRFVDEDNRIREEFLDFVLLQRTVRKDIATAIKSALVKYHLPIQDLRGQGYDGAAAMSSANVGAHGLIREAAPLAVYTHCSGHCLNLVISHTCTLTAVRNMVDKLKECCLFFNKSPKRESLLIHIITHDEPESKRKKPLLNLCKTRWAERHDAYNHFRQSFKHIIACLEVIVHGLHYDKDLLGPWQHETKRRGSSLLAALTDFEFIMTVTAVYNSLSHMHGITVKLQSRAADIIEAHAMVQDVAGVYAELRDNVEETFARYYETACEMAVDVGVQPSRPRIARKQQHRCNVPAENPEEYYRHSLCIPLLDHVITDMGTRCSTLAQRSTSLLGLVPSVLCKQKPDLADAISMYKGDLPSPTLLPEELHRWEQRYKRKDPNDCPNSCAKAIKECQRESFPNLHILLQLACTIPVTSCECERSASALRRLKTFMRASMGQERLSSLALMHIHYDVPVDVEQTVDYFAARFPRKLQLKSMLYEWWSSIMTLGMLLPWNCSAVILNEIINVVIDNGDVDVKDALVKYHRPNYECWMSWQYRNCCRSLSLLNRAIQCIKIVLCRFYDNCAPRSCISACVCRPYTYNVIWFDEWWHACWRGFITWT